MAKKLLSDEGSQSQSTVEQKKSNSCAVSGCHGRAHKGSIFCFPHDPGVIKTGGAPAGNLNAATPGTLYSKFLTDDERMQFARTGEIKGIDAEIQAARVLVMRLLAENDHENAIRAIALVARLEAQTRRENGGQATGIIEAVNTILEELNIGGGPGELSPGLN
jgi:hypothetical protein